MTILLKVQACPCMYTVFSHKNNIIVIIINIVHSSPVNEQLRAEIDLLRAKSQIWFPQIKHGPTNIADKPQSGELLYMHTQVGAS